MITTQRSDHYLSEFPELRELPEIRHGSLGQRWSAVGRDRKRMESRLRAVGIAAGAVVAGTILLRLIGGSHGGAAATQAQAQPTQGAPLLTSGASGVSQQTVLGGTPVAGGQGVQGALGTPAALQGGATPAAFGAAAPGTGSTAAGLPGQRTDSALATPFAGSSVSQSSLGNAAGVTGAAGMAGSAGAVTASSRSATFGASSLATPGTSGSSSSGRTHTVKSGDTLLAIAKNNNTTVEALVAANHLTSPDETLTIGQKLTLP